MSDLALSVKNIQAQSGAETSANGVAAIRCPMNMQTSEMKSETYGEVNTAVGSFNTPKTDVILGSGLMDNGWQFERRPKGHLFYFDDAASFRIRPLFSNFSFVPVIPNLKITLAK